MWDVTLASGKGILRFLGDFGRNFVTLFAEVCVSPAEPRRSVATKLALVLDVIASVLRAVSFLGPSGGTGTAHELGRVELRRPLLSVTLPHAAKVGLRALETRVVAESS